MIQAGALLLLMLFPAMFLMGGWLLDRRARKRREPLFRRLFALGAYSGWVLVGFVAWSILSAALPRYPSTNERLLTIAVMLSMSWIYLFFLTLSALIFFTVTGLAVKYLIHRET